MSTQSKDTSVASAERPRSYDGEQQHSFMRLSLVFWAWKAFLLLIAMTSPGPGYDTSTTLMALDMPDDRVSVMLGKMIRSFVRWDSIYFTNMAQRGHLYEQDWAFGIGISSTFSWLARNACRCDYPRLSTIALSGIVLSHVMHYFAMLLVWRIAQTLVSQAISGQRSIPFVAAVLYTVSPAGIFLSAPYTESVFAFCNLFGTYLYMLSISERRSDKSTTYGILLLASGIVFGIATVVRSNGILSGALFAFDALEVLSNMYTNGVHRKSLLMLAFLTIGGSTIAVGTIGPQLLAYREYCSNVIVQHQRGWCQRTIPSIFAFVQSHYWNVGPFRYWTLSNLPLFTLAGPVLYLMTNNSISVIASYWTQRSDKHSLPHSSGVDLGTAVRFALPELLLPLLALSTYHVQIITRISSGYPLWYVGLAAMMVGNAQPRSKTLVRFMVLYAAIQAALYSSFLPPA